MPFDGPVGEWEAPRREPPSRMPRWLPFAAVTFGAMMGAVFGFQAAVAVGLFCSMALSWTHALTTVPGPLFQPFVLAGACLGGGTAAWIVRSRRMD